MTTSKLFRIASILALIVYSVVIIMGLIYAIYGNLMPYHLNYIGLTVVQISSFDPELAILAALTIRLVGFLFLSSGALLIMIWYFSFRKAEKWSWIANLIAGALIIIPLLFVTFVVGGLNIPFPIVVVSLGLWIGALSLSIQEVFMNDTTDT